jgi:hypothetical protein
MKARGMTTVLAVVLGLSLAVPVAGQKGDPGLAENPEYASWARFNPGSSVTRQWWTVEKGRKKWTDTTIKLLAIDSEKVILEIKLVVHRSLTTGDTNEPQPAVKRTVPVKIDKAKLSESRPGVTVTRKEADVFVGQIKMKGLELTTVTKSPKGDVSEETTELHCEGVPGGWVSGRTMETNTNPGGEGWILQYTAFTR